MKSKLFVAAVACLALSACNHEDKSKNDAGQATPPAAGQTGAIEGQQNTAQNASESDNFAQEVHQQDSTYVADATSSTTTTTTETKPADETTATQPGTTTDNTTAPVDSTTTTTTDSTSTTTHED